MESRYTERFAADKTRNEQYMSVIVDGNRNTLVTTPVVTNRSEIITVARCKEIVANINSAFGTKASRIEVDMTLWNYDEVKDSYDLVLSGDIPMRTLKGLVVAHYDVEENCLIIYKDHEPVYQNYDGVITRDRDALADTYM